MWVTLYVAKISWNCILLFSFLWTCKHSQNQVVIIVSRFVSRNTRRMSTSGWWWWNLVSLGLVFGESQFIKINFIICNKKGERYLTAGQKILKSPGKKLVKLYFWQFETSSQFKNWVLAIFEIAKNGIWSKNFFREIDLPSGRTLEGSPGSPRLHQ